MTNKIPITRCVFDDADLAAVQQPLLNGWVVQGPYVAEFEERFARMAGARHAAACSSCTTALHLSMAALELRPGDEVLVPAFTWVATANCVEYMGARPVFVDIDLRTFNIDVSQIERHITPRTRGIIPVHLFGLVADMDAILEVARRHHLWIVEDAACAFDSWYDGKHAGTFGDAGCFSFHPRKAITTGEGGMVVTQRAELDRLVRTLRDHGASATDLQRHQGSGSFLLSEYRHLGYNYRMTDLQGALGVAQMEKAAAIMESRRAAASRYDQMLKDVEWLELPYQDPKYVHSYQSYVCLFRPEPPSMTSCDRLLTWRNRLMAALEAEGVATRQGTHAPAHVPYYAERYGILPEDYPNAYLAERLSLALPLFAGMTEAEQSRVVDLLQAEIIHARA